MDKAKDIRVSGAARELGVSVTTVWNWIRAGRLSAYKVGPHCHRVPAAEVEALIEWIAQSKEGKSDLQE